MRIDLYTKLLMLFLLFIMDFVFLLN